MKHTRMPAHQCASTRHPAPLATVQSEQEWELVYHVPDDEGFVDDVIERGERARHGIHQPLQLAVPVPHHHQPNHQLTNG